MMEYRTVYMRDVTQTTWNSYMTPEATYYHSWMWLNYATKIAGVTKNDSFAMLDNKGFCLAVCPLTLTKSDAPILASGPNPLGSPAFSHSLTPSQRRKLETNAIDHILSYGKKKKVSEVQMVWCPFSMAYSRLESPSYLNYHNSFSLLRYDFEYRVENTVAIDLSVPEDILKRDLGKDRRYSIRKGVRDGIIYTSYRGNNPGLKQAFQAFRLAHIKAAGRETRPRRTWVEMREICKRGEGTLFVASRNFKIKDETPLSYLFCGEFSGMAFGWSQANVKEYEKEFSPRRPLEWEAILHYKHRGFKWYEVGDRPFGPNNGYEPSEKEISIGIFKERFGGVLLPKVYWRKKL